MKRVWILLLASACASKPAASAQPTESATQEPAVPSSFAASPKTEPSEPTATGSLETGEIHAVVHHHMGEIRSCYDEALTRTGMFEGRMMLQFVIESSGEVDVVTVQETTLADPQLSDCIVGVVERFVFPQPEGGGKVVVTYPFVFEPELERA